MERESVAQGERDGTDKQAEGKVAGTGWPAFGGKRSSRVSST